MSKLDDEQLEKDTEQLIDDGLQQADLINNLAASNAHTFASQKLDEEAEKTKEKEDDINLTSVTNDLFNFYVKPDNKPQEEEKK